MPEQFSRRHALRVLALASTADTHDVKRAYRRLAREHHPDHGGDPELFHELQQAFERLVGDDTVPPAPVVARGRPSRPRPTPAPDRLDADLSTVDWTTPRPSVGDRLDRHRTAAALLCDDGRSVRAVTATSRAPGSRLNGVAIHMAGNMTSTLSIRPSRDDRGRPVLAVELRGWNRRSRRALEQASLPDHWTRVRGSSSTRVQTALSRGSQQRATIVRAVDQLERLLGSLSWEFDAWTLTHDPGSGVPGSGSPGSGVPG